MPDCVILHQGEGGSKCKNLYKYQCVNCMQRVKE